VFDICGSRVLRICVVRVAPEGRKKVAGGKRSAALGRHGLNKSPGRGERCACGFLSPLQGVRCVRFGFSRGCDTHPATGRSSRKQSEWWRR
jgi:hypothetical protein